MNYLDSCGVGCLRVVFVKSVGGGFCVSLLWYTMPSFIIEQNVWVIGTMAPRKKKNNPIAERQSLADAAGEAPLRRQLPQDIEAECGLLGSILIDPPRVWDLCATSGVVAEAFVEPAHRIIFAAIERLAAQGTPIDGITLAKRPGS